MSKIDENKQQKLESLFISAYELFLKQGIERTTISEIAKHAGVAKGTFYLYFEDKYQIRDRLLARVAGKLFQDALDHMTQEKIPDFEDRILYLVDYILTFMRENKPILRFISKNLSWGIFRHALTMQEPDTDKPTVEKLCTQLLASEKVHLRAPETMLFLIIELASSSSFSTILENDPMSFEELKPFLYQSIRAIIRNHIIPSDSN